VDWIIQTLVELRPPKHEYPSLFFALRQPDP